MKEEWTWNFLATLSPISTSIRVRQSPGFAIAKPTVNSLTWLKKCEACSALCFKLLTPDYYQVRTISIIITVIALLLIISRKSCTLIVELFISVEEQLLLKNLLYCESRWFLFHFFVQNKSQDWNTLKKLFWGEIH